MSLRIVLAPSPGVLIVCRDAIISPLQKCKYLCMALNILTVSLLSCLGEVLQVSG